MILDVGPQFPSLLFTHILDWNYAMRIADRQAGHVEIDTVDVPPAAAI